jgi:PilZ domain
MITGVPFRSADNRLSYASELQMPLQQEYRRSRPSVRDRRIHNRSPFDRRITINGFHAGESLSLWGRTSDVSLGGIGATIVGELAVNDVVAVQIPLCGGEQLNVRAVVLNRQGFHYGFEFLVLGESSRQMLRQMCEETRGPDDDVIKVTVSPPAGWLPSICGSTLHS